VNTRFTKMEDIYMSGEWLCRTETRQANAGLSGRTYSHPSSVTLEEHQGFHFFSEIVLLLFDFFVTGGTYMTTKLGPKCSKKLKKKIQKAKVLYVHICFFSEVEVAMTRTGKLCFDCL